VRAKLVVLDIAISRKKLDDGSGSERWLRHQTGELGEAIFERASVRSDAKRNPDGLSGVRGNCEGRARHDRDADAIGVLREVSRPPMAGQPQPEVMSMRIGREADVAQNRCC
jgi:hypothetical protein